MMATLQQTLNRALSAYKPERVAKPRRGSKLRAKIEADPRVAFVEVEPTDGWFITLAPGWSYVGDPGNVHCFGADTLTEAWAEIRQSPCCSCEQCKRELAA